MIYLGVDFGLICALHGPLESTFVSFSTFGKLSTIISPNTLQPTLLPVLGDRGADMLDLLLFSHRSQRHCPSRLSVSLSVLSRLDEFSCSVLKFTDSSLLSLLLRASSKCLYFQFYYFPLALLL